ncbi:DUF421 domain-containing protein [Actinophytocola glycyrrhizae]|uniref:DUF421 domain-containing protein n=1 Tax=Actinophytocola glycyrrhizae TaxID=2044873 RepID=A0ABV9RUV3_9PSEU
MFFDTWSAVGRIALVGTIAFVVVVAMLRLSGKRTLAKMNAFDLVVTVALGSTLATILLSQRVAVIEGVTALAVLVLLQFLVAWLAVRSTTVKKAVKSSPTFLVRRGQLLTAVLRDHRVSAEEVYQAVRANGLGDLESVDAVVLETDGSFSVITVGSAGSRGALADVR